MSNKARKTARKNPASAPRGNRSPRPSGSPLHQYLFYSSLGFQMIALILGGFFLGEWLDEELQHGKHLYTIIGCLLGIFIGLYLTLRKLLSSSE